MGVIAVVGKYRTGKSYLMNKLFLQELKKDTSSPMPLEMSKGFQVSPTINPCTKGLWLCRRLLHFEDENGTTHPVIVIDTEGLGAFDEDENHDAKIFLLALLLSSLLLYNSVGTIDENALNTLSLVINLSKQIQIKQNKGEEVDADELAECFPRFFWILRDFSLRLIDSDGNKISAR